MENLPEESIKLISIRKPKINQRAIGQWACKPKLVKLLKR